MAADTARRGRDHRRGALLLNFPVEEVGIKVLRLDDVFAADFKMHYRASHRFAPLFRELLI